MGGNKGTYITINVNIDTHIYLVFPYMGGNKGTYFTI